MSVRQHALQFKVLMKKNWWLHLRNWKSTLIQLVSPCVFVIILYALQVLYVSMQNNPDTLHPVAVPIPSIPRCRDWNLVDGKPHCHTLLFAPANDSLTEEVVRSLAQHNDPPLTVGYRLDDPSLDIVGVASEANISNYVLNYPNTTQAALVFTSGRQFGFNYFIYEIMYNTTNNAPDTTVNVLHAVDNAILRTRANKKFGVDATTAINVTARGFPEVAPPWAGDNVVSTVGSFWLYCPPMFNFIILLNQVVTEKELKLRLGMKIMGLKDSMFWLSWFVFNSGINFLSTLILIGSGAAFGFDVFTNADFFVNFMIYFLFSTSMIPLCFLVSSFIQQAKTANTVGFVIFVFGLFVQIIFTGVLVYFWWTDNASPVFRYIFMFYPPFNFAKSFADVSSRSSGTIVNGEYIKGSGYRFEDLFKTIDVQFLNVTAPETYISLLYLLMNTAVFSVFAWYFDNVMPGENGTPRPLYFLFTREYWGFTKPTTAGPALANTPLTLTAADDVNEDVRQEITRALNGKGQSGGEPVIRILRLSKTYQKYPFVKSEKDFTALSDLCLSVDANTCLCLLGHNGAGKTTTINILTGLFSPSHGDAYICGYSVRNEMDSIRRILGVCPQHDILWKELTAREHLEIFAEFKGVPSNKIKQVVEEKLHEVELFDVRNNSSSTFSGGMRRRLSLAISCIGEPRVIFMDEPTTGLDPLARRKVWNLIDKMKRDRVIILTTHSMEEADTLSDRIAIMAKGKLRCIGSSLHLKNRYGEGYHINLIVERTHLDTVKSFVAKTLPAAKLVADNSGSLHYVVPTHNTPSPALTSPSSSRSYGSTSSTSPAVVSANDKFSIYSDTSESGNATENAIIGFFAKIEDNVIPVRDWGLSHTTLEEVFLRVTKESQSNHYN